MSFSFDTMQSWSLGKFFLESTEPGHDIMLKVSS